MSELASILSLSNVLPDKNARRADLSQFGASGKGFHSLWRLLISYVLLEEEPAPRRGCFLCCHRCRVERYCSLKCQQEDWPLHLLYCEGSSKRENQDEAGG
eukprot:gene57512-biopygen5682